MLTAICLMLGFPSASTSFKHVYYFRFTQNLELDAMPELPAHWRNVNVQGEDSWGGKFVSSERTDLVIRYDIGRCAGDYAKPRAHRMTKWMRAARLDNSYFHYLLTTDDMLYVTFYEREPSGFTSPANFFTRVDGLYDVDYVLELLARHRRELLAQP